MPISEHRTVCVVGAGPAGVMTAYMLARKGVSTVLLESQQDFDRDFRGDTLHASSMDILDQLGIADDVLALANAKVEKLSFDFSGRSITLADFSTLDTHFPFVAVVPQEKFLSYVVDIAKQLPQFEVRMGAQVRELKVSGEKINGVRFTWNGEDRELDADLIIAADGRSSTVRELAEISLTKTSPPMDILWFKLPVPANDVAPEGVSGRIGPGNIIAIINRKEYLQVGYIILKGNYRALREAGIEKLQNDIETLMPELADSVSALKDWSQLATLGVVTGRVSKWYRDGLLLIGDAAHIMSPVGGVGINYAIQDAVATVNQLFRPLLESSLATADLAAVQTRREPAVAAIQRFQAMAQQRVIKGALNSKQIMKPPLPLRLISSMAFTRKKMAHFIAYGTRHERVE